MASVAGLLWWWWCCFVWSWPWSLAAGPDSLHFRGNSFKMALFADLHFGEAENLDWGPLQDVKSQGVMSFILDAEKPDLVIFLGDILTANNIVVHNATNYWSEAISSTFQRNLSWASVFGNHDDMPFEWPMDWFGTAGIPGEQDIHDYFEGTTRAELMTYESIHNASFSTEGSRTLWPSVSNYALQIFPQSSTIAEPLLILYFFDSGGGSYPKLISARQASWFRSLASELNPDQRIPELAFWHIPTQAYANIAPTPGSPIQPPCVGSINLEAVDPQVAELGFMEVISSRSSMRATFVGHNHGLDWCCPMESAGAMYLCFARHTGYGGYGTWTRGARMIEVTEDPFHLRTYILLEDGTISATLDVPLLSKS